MPSDVDLRELGSTLHDRLLNRKDDRVTAEIAELFLPLLVSDLKKHYSNLSDLQLIESVAIDTLMTYFERPWKFDPTKRSLIGYLYMDADGDLRNILRQQQISFALRPQIPEHVMNAIEADADPEQTLLEGSSPLVRRVLEYVPDATDRRLLLLMMDGVRETAEYAEVLGIQDLPPEKQARIVKRNKDRLKKSVKTKLEKSGRRR